MHANNEYWEEKKKHIDLSGQRFSFVTYICHESFSAFSRI